MEFPKKEMEGFFYDALGLSLHSQATHNRFFRHEDSSSLLTLKKGIEILRLQRLEKKHWEEDATLEHDPDPFTLPSILFICVSLIEERHLTHQSHTETYCIDLRSLDTFLLESYSFWFNSEKGLSDLVWNGFADREENLQRKNQIKTIVAALNGISPLAQRGLELCLLEILMI